MQHTLADVLPSVAASFGVSDPNPLAIEENRDVVVLLVDGLGAQLLIRGAHEAPTLAGHVTTTLRRGSRPRRRRV